MPRLIAVNISPDVSYEAYDMRLLQDDGEITPLSPGAPHIPGVTFIPLGFVSYARARDQSMRKIAFMQEHWFATPDQVIPFQRILFIDTGSASYKPDGSVNYCDIGVFSVADDQVFYPRNIILALDRQSDMCPDLDVLWAQLEAQIQTFNAAAHAQAAFQFRQVAQDANFQAQQMSHQLMAERRLREQAEIERQQLTELLAQQLDAMKFPPMSPGSTITTSSIDELQETVQQMQMQLHAIQSELAKAQEKAPTTAAATIDFRIDERESLIPTATEAAKEDQAVVESVLAELTGIIIDPAASVAHNAHLLTILDRVYETSAAAGVEPIPDEDAMLIFAQVQAAMTAPSQHSTSTVEIVQLPDDAAPTKPTTTVAPPVATAKRPEVLTHAYDYLTTRSTTTKTQASAQLFLISNIFKTYMDKMTPQQRYEYQRNLLLGAFLCEVCTVILAHRHSEDQMQLAFNFLAANLVYLAGAAYTLSKAANAQKTREAVAKAAATVFPPAVAAPTKPPVAKQIRTKGGKKS